MLLILKSRLSWKLWNVYKQELFADLHGNRARSWQNRAVNWSWIARVIVNTGAQSKSTHSFDCFSFFPLIQLQNTAKNWRVSVFSLTARPCHEQTEVKTVCFVGLSHILWSLNPWLASSLKLINTGHSYDLKWVSGTQKRLLYHPQVVLYF